MRTLIAFHSRSGNTRRVAQALARRLHADLEEIRIVQPLDGALGYLMCAIESLAGLAPALRPALHGPAAYDLVLVGTPVWFWNVSSPVRSWLERNRPTQRVGFFCTMGGSGAQRAFATMAALCGREPAATLALTEVESAAMPGERLDGFVQRLQATAAPRRHARHRARPGVQPARA
jgi:flavodoxin